MPSNSGRSRATSATILLSEFQKKRAGHKLPGLQEFRRAVLRERGLCRNSRVRIISTAAHMITILPVLTLAVSLQAAQPVAPPMLLRAAVGPSGQVRNGDYVLDEERSSF